MGGNHIAFLLQGENVRNVNNSGQDGAEIDVFESAWVTNDTKAVIHFDGYGPDKKNHTIPYDTPGLHRGYHIFGMQWSPTEIHIYYDGQEVMSTNPYKPFPFTTDPNGYPLVLQVPEWLWLSVGASFGDGDFINQPVGVLSDAKVDWVRVFKSSETLSTDQNITQSSIALYPNPVDNIVNIKTPLHISKVEIFNLNARILKTINSMQNNTLDVSDLLSSTYIIKLYSQQKIFRRKIIVR